MATEGQNQWFTTLPFSVVGFRQQSADTSRYTISKVGTVATLTDTGTFLNKFTHDAQVADMDANGNVVVMEENTVALFNSSGVQQWQYQYTDISVTPLVGEDVVFGPSGDIHFTVGNATDVYLYKLDASDGSVLWSKTWSRGSNTSGGKGSLAVSYDTGDVFCVRNHYSGGFNHDTSLVHTDSSGNVLTSRVYDNGSDFAQYQSGESGVVYSNGYFVFSMFRRTTSQQARVFAFDADTASDNPAFAMLLSDTSVSIGKGSNGFVDDAGYFISSAISSTSSYSVIYKRNISTSTKVWSYRLSGGAYTPPAILPAEPNHMLVQFGNTLAKINTGTDDLVYEGSTIRGTTFTSPDSPSLVNFPVLNTSTSVTVSNAGTNKTSVSTYSVSSVTPDSLTLSPIY